MRNFTKLLFLITLTLFSLANYQVVDARMVKSFDELDRAETYKDLYEYGLLPPETYNHTAGKNLIMLALKATSYFKGDWVMAHGLLGCTMLNVDVYDRMAYENIFLTLCDRSKYYNSAENKNTLLKGEWWKDFEFVKTNSVITKRENVIAYLSSELNGRYIYNDEGNYSRSYMPEPKRKSNRKLYQGFKAGFGLYTYLKGRGFNDECLGDLLGITFASLSFDSFNNPDLTLDAVKLGRPVQIYTDALIATLNGLKQNMAHSQHFLEVLSHNMGARGLATQDPVLLPSDEASFEAFLKIVEEDLKLIEKKQ